MAANVTLTVNVEQAKAALNQVNSAITQIKLNGNQITIGGHKVAQQMGQVANATQQVANATEQAGKTSAQNINKITSGFKSITGASSKALNSIRAFGKGMVSVWTAVVMAVELAAVTFKYFFENLTQSIPKVISKSQNLVSITEKQTQKFEKEKKETDDLRKSLQQLAQKQTLSNSEQVYAQAIIDKLNKRYKDLKITIDQTTGAIKGLTEAEYKMDLQDRKREIGLTKRQIFAQRQATNAQLANTFGTSKVSLDKGVSGNDFFTFAENTFGDLSSLDRDRLASKWSNGNLYDKKKVLEDLATDYSNNEEIVGKINGAIDALDKLIDLQQKFNDLNSASSMIISNQNGQLEKTKGVLGQITSLQQKSKQSMQSLAKAQEEEYYNSLQTNQQKADYIQQQLDTLNKEAEDAKDGIKNLTDELSHNNYLEDISVSQTNSFKKQIEDNDAAVTKLRQNIQKIGRDLKKQTGRELTIDSYSMQYRNTLNQRLSFLNKKIANGEDYNNGAYKASDKVYAQRDAIVEQLEAIDKVLKITKEIKQVETQRDKLVEQLNDNLQISNQAEQTRLETEKKLEELKTAEAEKQLQIQQKKTKLAELQKAIEEQRVRQQKSIQEIYGNYEAQLDAYNKSTEELAIQTALANAQKAKGAELTQDQIDQIKFYVTQLQNMKKLEEQRKQKKRQADAVQGVFKGYEQNQTIAYMKMINKQKEAVLLQAKLNAQKAKGAALTEEEYDSLKNYVDVQQLIEEANGVGSNLNLKGQNIISNELAAKGGFASSVVVDRAQDVNKEILAVQNKQYDLQQQIKTALDKYSVIQ